MSGDRLGHKKSVALEKENRTMTDDVGAVLASLRKHLRKLAEAGSTDEERRRTDDAVAATASALSEELNLGDREKAKMGAWPDSIIARLDASLEVRPVLISCAKLRSEQQPAACAGRSENRKHALTLLFVSHSACGSRNSCPRRFSQDSLLKQMSFSVRQLKSSSWRGLARLVY